MIYFPLSFQRDGEPVPLRVNGKLDPVAAEGCYAFQPKTSLPDGGRGAGGAGVICDGCLVGLVWQRAADPPLLIIRSMAQVLHTKPVREAIEKHTGLSTKLEHLEPVQLSARIALNEVSSADPSNIQQVAAGTLYQQPVL